MPALGPADAAAAAKLRQAVVLHNQGRLAEAAAIYERLLAVAPGNADALHLLGLVKLQRGEAGGVALIERAIAANPRVSAFHVSLAKARMSLGQTDAAAESLRRAAALRRDDPEPLMHLGVLERGRGDLAAAEDCFRRAARLPAAPLAALNNLAAVLLEQRRFDEAAGIVDRALARAPDDPLALGNLGQVMIGRGDFAGALAPLRRAAERDPANAMILNNLGNALVELHRPEEAVTVLRRAVAAAPDAAVVHVSLGNALKRVKDYEEALRLFERADRLKPGIAEVLSHIGTCHLALTNYPAAIAAFTASLEINPNHANARLGRAFVELVNARFDAGWSDYLARPSRVGRTGFVDAPLSRDLNGETLNLLCDQGLGDELFFLRFVPELRRRGARRIVYYAGAKIASIIGRIDGLDEVSVASDKHMETHRGERTISVADLPFLLGMSGVEDIPPSLRLPPLPERLAETRERLSRLGPPPYVGLTWRGGTENFIGGLLKLAPAGELGRVLRETSATAIALQRLPKAGELDDVAAAAGREVHDLTALNDDLEGMLALLALLDDYVCVSNTNVHLRAGTGRTSRVLVPCPPEFRWMAEGDESPWFPGHRVYRQTTDRSWEPAFAALARDLAEAFPPR